MPSTALRRQLMSNVRSMVVKVGTMVLTDQGGRLDRGLIGRIARQLATLHRGGIKVTLVSSGAIGAGMGRTGMASRPRSTSMLQAAAAIGQPTLMSLYEKTLAKQGLHAGQILVTREDFEQRVRYVNISNTLAALHRMHAIPIINENDTTAIDELDRFADNDTIAALVANLLQADLLVLLTVVDGLLDMRGQLIDFVPDVSDQVQSLAKSGRSALGSGGMMGKLVACKMVTSSGEIAVIANGRQTKVLIKVLEGERVGTIFAPAARKMRARQKWLLNAVRPVGRIVIDGGATEAVRTRGKSLLSRGIIGVQGKFERGAIVRIVTEQNVTIAHGISNYSHAELEKIKGLKSSEIIDTIGQKPFDEAIHRDNLVLTSGHGQ
ncbi:MAG: glutamate 5-kinase [Planctomycetota bacterium]|nr:MAG: glutamate 5-kinase [Planctomycetota bacterium]